LSIFLAPIGSGLGDVLISLPVVQALLDRGEETYFVRRSFRQEGVAPRIEGLAGDVSEEEVKARLGADDTYINLRAHPIQTDYLWGSPEFEAIFGVTRMEKIIALIAADWGLQISYDSLRPLAFSRREEVRGKILFIPGTDGYYKHWPQAYWLELRRLLAEKGHDVIVVGRPDESPSVKALLELGLPWIETATAGDAVDVVSSAAAVVSVDTGLMHVAVQQGLPVFTFIHPGNFHERSAANCSNFYGVHCPPQCGRDTAVKEGTLASDALAVGLKFDHHLCRMPTEQNCMAGITPYMVLEEMVRRDVVASSEPAPPRS